MKRRILLACLAFLAAPPTAGAQDSDLVASTTLCTPDQGCVRFEFHSSFWLNLHNHLFMEARLRLGLRASTLAGSGEIEFLERQARPLSPEEALIHERVLDAFVASKVAGPLPDSVVLRVENRLARVRTESELERVDVRPEVREALTLFAPIYRAVWWPVHDARNREWIAEQRRYLGVSGDLLLQRLASSLGGPLPAVVRIDASTYANWFGAYTTFDPPHITMSSSARGSQGTLGLETLLHEAGHLILAPVNLGIAAEAGRQDRPVPPQLSHLLLFFTAGEVVRMTIPGHRPYAETFGIWSQNETARRYQRIVRRFWSPYMRGATDFETALARLVRDSPR